MQEDLIYEKDFIFSFFYGIASVKSSIIFFSFSKNTWDWGKDSNVFCYIIHEHCYHIEQFKTFAETVKAAQNIKTITL